MMNHIFVCTTCQVGFDIAAFQNALADRVGPLFSVSGHGCFSSCTDPLAIAFRADDKAAYVFGGLSEDDIEDIAAFADLWVAAKNGWVEDARPSGRMRFCLKARVPVRAIPQ